MSDIKSAKRVIELFEYFAERKAPALASDIAKALGYPQSSTSLLLHTLVNLGYMDLDRRQRLYAPSVRLALLGNWIQTANDPQASIGSLMQALLRTTGESVILGMQRGLEVQYAFVLETQEHAIRWHLRIGTTRPLLHAALGQVLLASKPPEEARRLIWQCNAKAEARFKVEPAAFEQRLSRIRTQGFAVSDSTITKDAMVVAVMLPAASTVEVAAPCAIGVGGPVARIKAKQPEILAALREIVSRMPPVAERPAPVRATRRGKRKT